MVEFIISAPRMYPTEVHVHSYSSDSVMVSFRGVSTQAEEEPLQGYKASTVITSKLAACQIRQNRVDELLVCKGSYSESFLKCQSVRPDKIAWLHKE